MVFFALHHGIVVIQYQTGIFRHRQTPFMECLPIIADFPPSGNQENPLANFEQMCYNIRKQWEVDVWTGGLWM